LVQRHFSSVQSHCWQVKREFAVAMRKI